MTSKAYVVDVKGNLLGRTNCLASFVIIALIFPDPGVKEGTGISPPPVPEDQKKPCLNSIN